MNDNDPTMKLPDPGANPGAIPSAGELLARALRTPGPSVGDGRWTPPEPEELARLLPQYQIESLLGHGGRGAVSKGRQAALDRPVAIKLLPAEMAADAQFIARFQREARTLAKLQHPGIVAVHDFGQTSEGHLYFVMEFVDGTDLHRILHAPGGLNPAQALALISQICDALHYAHGKGVIHRDIKPGNILVTTDSRAKLADFGLARPIVEESTVLTGTNVIMGTAAYMAPEQQEGRSDQRADIYALGVMLYEMLCGQRPSGAFDPPSHRVQVDVRLDDVVIKAMQQQPERRYQQVSEMKTDVDRIRTTPEQRKPAPKPKSKSPVAAAVIAVCLTLASVAGVLAWKKAHQPDETERVAHAAPSTTLPAATPEPAAVRVWDSPEKLPKDIKGLSWEDGVISFDAQTRAVMVDGRPITQYNSIVRFSLRMNRDARWANAYIRDSGTRDAPHAYRFLINPPEGKVDFFGEHGERDRKLQTWRLPRTYGEDEWIRVELRAIGNDFTVAIDGQQLGTVHDDVPSRPGMMGFGAMAKCHFRDIVYVPLDATPLTATKDAPFVNTLGQEFVPVPGTQVLFCRWETRVKDYTAYARMNKVDTYFTRQVMDGVPAGREPEHPVCGVIWDEAKAFCEWLTKKEVAEGKLAKGKEYRLPTDEEWSRAAGLQSEDGATPKERSGKNRVDFPWGTDWPPKGKAGNYADETFHTKFPLKGTENQWLGGYTDGFATTAPVGSFEPNAYGIYDLGGNVWEWCEDLYEPSGTDRVWRGGSWLSPDRTRMLSSHRIFIAPGARYYDVGFRCVLAPATSAPPKP